MIERQKIVNEIFDVLEKINKHLSSGALMSVSEDTEIMGKASKLDSLKFLNLITSLEDSIEEQFDVMITIANEETLTMEKNPFRTVRTLADHIAALIEKEIANG